ncbi:MAG: D-cysteine desulfhydrase family protein [Candidatus Latescibacterota bacterium]|jgi:D-cysteine desulfhydrase|nr:MAG: D-cysteine desulfhydrase family protein [Candidatus Latescibacterota bacterium]
MAIDLDSVPRLRLNFLPTPLVELARLGSLLGGPRIFMKRDDLTGLGLGGNKTRKLEFLLGDALARGCDCVVTGGAMQSNHCRQTAAACAASGFECHLALGGEPPRAPSGTLLLDYLFGAIVHWCGGETKGERIPSIAGELRAIGRRPYLIPFGGSNAVGALGFVAAIAEVERQLREMNVPARRIVIPSSSGGTHAGMAVGVDLRDMPVEVTGIGIDRDSPGEPPYEEELAGVANAVAALLETETRYAPADFDMRYGYLGGGYAVVGELEREAIRLVASTEGILLDPVYSGRAMGALIDMIRSGELSRSEPVVFWHTGGIPAIFEHERELGPA